MSQGGFPRVANLCRVLWNGGVQRTAIAQTEGLRALGFEVDLYFLRRVSEVAFPLPPGTRVLDRPIGRLGLTGLQRVITAWFAGHRGRDATVDLDRLWAARRAVRKYDVAIYNDQYASLLGIWNRFAHSQPYVMVFHEFYPKVATGPRSWLLNPFADLIDALSVLLAPAIVTTSGATQSRLDRIVPGRTRLARLGAPPPSPGLALPDRDRRSVFSITIWDRGRHPELYLEVAKRNPEFRVVLAGVWADPDHLAEVREQARALPNVTITGAISEADRMALQAGALLYLRYGFGESGPGIGGLEALSCGSIVICNRGLGLAEIISNGQNGFVLATPDPDEASKLLTEIDRMSPEQLARISRAAVETAKENSWARHSQVLAEALRSVVRG
jgi:glycosyltransferase involved in cell wall biosynthesis